MNGPKPKTRRTISLFSLTVALTFLAGCVTTRQLPADFSAFKSRTETIVQHNVTVSVAVPTIMEAQGIYGVALAQKHIQPVWIEVRNDSPYTYWFLPSGMDPNYFFPSEAAFAFYTGEKESNRQLYEKFQKLGFQNPIKPESTRSGFLLVNLDEGFKAIDIDLLSSEGSKSYSFIISDPEFKADHKELDFETLYDSEELIHIEDEEDLRRVIEGLPCCSTDADGNTHGDPLNLILIGNPNDIVPALVRRNWHATETTWSKAVLRTIKSFLKGERYRYSPISPLYVYGRRQDVGWQKARSTITKRNHMRFWLSPIRFKGRQVWIGQISRDIGIKFTLKSPTISTHVIDPDVDEARRYFVEDMAYSQALTKFGFSKGVGIVHKDAPRKNLVGDPYYTDGLRAVLFFEPRPYPLSEIEMLEWESPSGYYKRTR